LASLLLSPQERGRNPEEKGTSEREKGKAIKRTGDGRGEVEENRRRMGK
jgi:hypothetical protein